MTPGMTDEMSKSEPLILIIEDEMPVRRFLKMVLSNHGFELCEASTGKEGMAMAATLRPDVILLDLGLPDIDGLDVTRQLRDWTKVPIIVLSARGKEQDKVEVLDAGADDYLTKPFGVAELLARIRVSLRHAARLSSVTMEPEFSFGNVHVDLSGRRVYLNQEEVKLTRIEYKLLSALVRSAGKVVTQNQLLKEIWGDECTDQSNYLRVYMAHLRRKLEKNAAHPEFFITEPGVGYRLKIDEP